MDFSNQYDTLKDQPLITEWLEEKYDLKKSIKTLRAYAYNVHDYLRFCRTQKINYLSAGHREIRAYVHDLNTRVRNRSEKVGVAQATKLHRITTIKMLYGYLVEKNIYKLNPVKYKKNSLDNGRDGLAKKHQKCLSSEQWSSILDCMRGETLRNRTMLAVGYECGLRVGELCALRIQHVDLTQREIVVVAATSKSDEDRRISFSLATAQLLTRYLRVRKRLPAFSDSLFISNSQRNKYAAITTGTWTKVTSKIATQAKIPFFNPHSLRHLRLTHLARQGWSLLELAKLAGHKSLVTTMKYIHLDEYELGSSVAKALRNIHKLKR